MPVYKDPRKTLKVSLPSLEGSEIEIYTTLLGGDVEVVASDVSTNDFTRSILLLSRLIKSWNLTQEDGTPLPITPESLKNFGVEDLLHILEHTELGKVAGRGGGAGK